MTLASSQVPYIGSTISLLSKAGIRYEGFLHSIDQSEASVTLDHVRVLGTEDRQCDKRVPPSAETFEYIIFRASDITELRVIDTPLSRPVPDPAIIRVQSKSAAEANGATAADKAGGSGRRRQARGGSTNARGRQRYPQQQQQQRQQLFAHSQQQQPPPPPPPQPMMQQQVPVQSLPPRSQHHHHHQQQPQRYRNDWYSYRGGHYAQYPRLSLYPAEFAASGLVASPNTSGNGNGGGRRLVMHFRRYHGNGGGGGGGGGPQRRSSSAAAGGGRGRQSRPRPHQSDGIAQAAAGAPTRYFSADYDFETANAEMAKLLTMATSAEGERGGRAGAPAAATASGNNGANSVIVNGDRSGSVAAAGGAGGGGGGGGARSHAGYDKERSFYDDISRVDVEERIEAGGDLARQGGGGGSGAGGGGGRKEAAKQNALNRETFGLSGRRAIGGRLHGNYHNRMSQRRSPV